MSKHMNFERFKRAKINEEPVYVPTHSIKISPEIVELRKRKIPGMKPCGTAWCWRFIDDRLRFCSEHTIHMKKSAWDPK